MAIPDFQSLMLPVLQVVSEAGPIAAPDLRARVAERLSLSDDDLAERCPVVTTRSLATESRGRTSTCKEPDSSKPFAVACTPFQILGLAYLTEKSPVSTWSTWKSLPATPNGVSGQPAREKSKQQGRRRRPHQRHRLPIRRSKLKGATES